MLVAMELADAKMDRVDAGMASLKINMSDHIDAIKTRASHFKNMVTSVVATM